MIAVPPPLARSRMAALLACVMLGLLLGCTRTVYVEVPAAPVESVAPSPSASSVPATVAPTAPVSATANPAAPQTSQEVRPVAVAQAPAADPYTIAEQSVVQIQTLRGGRVIAAGSGVVIAQGKHVVTNHHVVTGGDAFRVSIQPRSGDRMQTTARIVADDQSVDLALLELKDALGTPVLIRRQATELGAPLVLAGFPSIGGSTITVTKGTVAGFEADGQLIKSDGTAGPGSSGGGALNADGTLAGIVVARKSDATGASLTYIISTDVVARVAGKALVPYSTANQSADHGYALSLLGLRASLTVPAGWKVTSHLSYFDAGAPGTNPRVVDSRYRIIGLFLVPGRERDQPSDVLQSIVVASGGRLSEVRGSNVTAPEGFSKPLIVRTVERYETSGREAATTPLGSWISEQGLITVFAAVETPEGMLVAYLELPNEEAIPEASGLFERIRLQR